jgi:hypothetical protein
MVAARAGYYIAALNSLPRAYGSGQNERVAVLKAETCLVQNGKLRHNRDPA